jgi:hypothetical protein
MQRPIGVTLLAIGAALAGLLEIWRAAVFMGWVKWTFVGKEVSFPDPQWGQVLWSLLLAAIWFWVAVGFWNVRAYAYSFGIFVSLFTLIFGFMAWIFGSSLEAETAPMLLAVIIFFYLNYPGVQKHFVDKELSLMTPAQRAALEQMQAANAAMAQATATAQAAPATSAPTTSAPPPPPSTPPTNPGASS